MTDNLITQVSQDNFGGFNDSYDEGSVDYNSKIHLNIRGQKFTITRDELMSLPESILLCLFPNGVFLDGEGQVITNLTEDDVVFVNFDPHCFQYIIDVFGEAHNDLDKSSMLSPQNSNSVFGKSFQNDAHNILSTKPAIIVLREDLDFYTIAPIPGLNEEDMRSVKLEVSNQLINNKFVFSGLGFNVDQAEKEQHLGPAEKHLFDMLCSSGFDPISKWGSRSMEPSKCVLLSLLLVRLGSQQPETPPESPNLDPVSSNASTNSRSRSRIATLASSASRAASRSISRRRNENNHNKLLLFWRKPARKCWWSNETITIDINTQSLSKKYNNKSTMPVKVHIRRVWTLELSVVGVQ